MDSSDQLHTSASTAQAGGLETNRPGTSRLLRAVGVFLLWTAIAGLFATQLYFAGLPWAVALAWTLPRWYSWGLVTPFIFRLDRSRAGFSSSTISARCATSAPAMRRQ